MGNYASVASPPKAAGEQFAVGEAAGARPPLLVDAGQDLVRYPTAILVPGRTVLRVTPEVVAAGAIDEQDRQEHEVEVR